MSAGPEASSYDRIHQIIDGLIAAADAKENMDEHRKLVEMIEADRHLLVGAKAMAAYVKQRFTHDTDYVVGKRMFRRIHRWLDQQRIPYQHSGETLRAETIGIDVIDASNHPVLEEILKRESGVPSPEALAATKDIAIVSGTRGQRQIHFDIGDLVGLVTLEGFDERKFLQYLVDRYEERRAHARELIEKIRRGDSPITI